MSVTAQDSPLNTNLSQSDAAATQSKVRSELASWDTLSKYKSHVLWTFGNELKAVLEEAGYDEMYGVKLVAPEEGYDDICLFSMPLKLHGADMFRQISSSSHHACHSAEVPPRQRRQAA